MRRQHLPGEPGLVIALLLGDEPMQKKRRKRKKEKENKIKKSSTPARQNHRANRPGNRNTTSRARPVRPFLIGMGDFEEDKTQKQNNNTELPLYLTLLYFEASERSVDCRAARVLASQLPVASC